MTDGIEEQIRRYAQAADEAAPPIEELVPPGMADELGLDPREVQITTTLTPLKSRRVAGWAFGLVAVIAVALLSIPIILLTGDDRRQFADTPPPTSSDATPTTIPVPVKPSLGFDRATGQLSGTGWPAGETVTATMGDVEVSGVVDQDGGFIMEPASFSECCFNELVVSAGATEIRVDEIPDVSVMRVDPERDVVSGSTTTDTDVALRITGGTEVFETRVSPSDNGWFIDLTGQFDLLPGMLVEARVEHPDLTVTHSSTERISPGIFFSLTGNELRGDSFAPVTPVSISIAGVAFEADVETSPKGEFSVSLGDGDLSPGVLVSVSDGISSIEAAVPVLTYDVFDPVAGVASGATDLPDDTGLYIELWMDSVGDAVPNEYAMFDTEVADGAWSVGFEPIPATWTVLSTNVGSALEGEYTVEAEFEGP